MPLPTPDAKELLSRLPDLSRGSQVATPSRTGASRVGAADGMNTGENPNRCTQRRSRRTGGGLLGQQVNQEAQPHLKRAKEAARSAARSGHGYRGEGAVPRRCSAASRRKQGRGSCPPAVQRCEPKKAPRRAIRAPRMRANPTQRRPLVAQRGIPVRHSRRPVEQAVPSNRAVHCADPFVHAGAEELSSADPHRDPASRKARRSAACGRGAPAAPR